MDGYTLPPDLEQFAAEEVAAGHFGDTAEVLRAAMDLLKRHRRAKDDLLASVLAAQEEGDRSGYLTADDVTSHVRATIACSTATRQAIASD